MPMDLMSALWRSTFSVCPSMHKLCVGEMTNIQSRTTDPEDARLMKLVEKKHRQEMKMARASLDTCMLPYDPVRSELQDVESSLILHVVLMMLRDTYGRMLFDTDDHLYAEVLDDFRRKEATAYQNMRHLVNDVKYVRQHIAKLFELLRQVCFKHCPDFTIAISDFVVPRCTSHSILILKWDRSKELFLLQVSSDVCDAFMHIDTPLPPADAADGTSAYASGDSGGYGGYSGNGITENGFSEHTGSASGRLPDARTAPLGGDARFNERGGNHVSFPIAHET